MSEFEKTKFGEKPAEDPETQKEDEGDDNGPVQEEESTAIFTPVVKLEAVEVRTYEEDEDVLHKIRAKLFEYGETLLDKGTGNKTWKEKGIGEAKFLKNRETGKIRLLMRQEKTMKVIANFLVDPRLRLTPHAGSNKSWVFACYDFSDAEYCEKTFAIRFNTVEQTTEFQEKFVECQNEMKSKDADALAEGLEKVTLNKEEEPKAEEATQSEQS